MAPEPPHLTMRGDDNVHDLEASRLETKHTSDDGLTSLETPSSHPPPPSSTACKPTGTSAPTASSLPLLDKLMPLLILLSMILGLLLGAYVPSTAPSLSRGTFLHVSGPLTAGLMLMLYPILLGVRFETLPSLFSPGSRKRFFTQLSISVVLNWLVAPLFMLGLSWAFLPDRRELREGLIFVGVARCIAMVLVWTHLAGGDGDYCAVLVAINSLLQIVLFAPLAVFYVQIVSRSPEQVGIGYAAVAQSVAAFLGVPLAAALITRVVLVKFAGKEKFARFARLISPLSLIALLYTIIILFASQGDKVVTQITSVLRVAAPLCVYFIVIFGITAWGMKRAGYGYGVSAAQSFTAASNNFELAIAVVVSVYGADSQQALASTVGPLIEVPVLVALVYVMKWYKKRYGWSD